MNSTTETTPPAVRTARDHCLAPERVDAPVYDGRYRRLFADLPALDVDEAALHALGRSGRPVRPRRSTSPTTPTRRVAAVWPFFGQFVAHDITADRSPLDASRRCRPDPQLPRAEGQPGGRSTAPARSARRTCTRKDDPAKLLLSPDGDDVPRNHEGIALIGDPRNDVHLFTSQMAVAFIKLHNRLVDRLREDGAAEDALFEEARRAATWHYQHVILREFLPGLIGAELTAELLECGPRLYRIGRRSLHPVRVRRRRLPLRPRADPRPLPGQRATSGRCRCSRTCMGFGPVTPERAVDWTLQIDVAGRPAAQRAKRIDARLPASLIALPTQISGSEPGTDYASLATRDLQRGQAVGLASGEAIAAPRSACRRSPPTQVGLAEHGWTGETPLWLYVLKEAEVAPRRRAARARSAAAIVGEVLVGIIDADPESFRSVEPEWKPTLPGRRAGSFGLADILVPPC